MRLSTCYFVSKDTKEAPYSELSRASTFYSNEIYELAAKLEKMKAEQKAVDEEIINRRKLGTANFN